MSNTGEITSYALRAPPSKTALGITVVPGEHVSVLDVVLPDAIKGENRLQAARVHVSERVASAEQDTVILPLRDTAKPEAWRRVLVMDRPKLDQYSEADAPARPVVPDFLTLPFRDDVIAICDGQSADYISARFGMTFGLTVRAEIAAECFAEILARMQGVTYVWCAADASEQVAALAQTLQLQPADPAVLTLPGTALYKLHDMRSAGVTARSKWLDLSNRFSSALVLLCLAVLIASGGMYWRSDQLAKLDAQLQKEIETIVRAEFLPSGPILDVRRQVTAALQSRNSAGAAQGGRGLEQLLSIASAPLTRDDLGLEQLAWSEVEGLVLRVRLESYAQLETLTTELEAAGLVVDVVDSNVGPSQNVTATLTAKISA